MFVAAVTADALLSFADRRRGVRRVADGRAAGGARGRETMLAAATALARTAADVLVDDRLRERAWDCWRHKADAGQ